MGQRSAEDLSQSLVKAGIKLMRFKTGTPARVDRRTLHTEDMTIQEGDTDGHAFSFMSQRKIGTKNVAGSRLQMKRRIASFVTT